MAFHFAPAPVRLRPRASGRACRCGLRGARMSGVNGGIDYDIDISKLPASIASHVQYVQGGPDSPSTFIDAAREIASASSEHPSTIPVLVDMLGFNNPIAANIAVDALVSAGRESVPSLLSGVAAFNYAVNAYALRALGRIGDPSVLDVCISCAERGPIPNVRRAACRALAGLHFENTEDAVRAHTLLVTLTRQENDWGVRYAAIVALENFTATHLLSDAERACAVDALRLAVQEGTSSEVAGKSEDGLPPRPVDPTVVARAAVALEAVQGA